MGLKIKWNDDRVRGTLAALLLIARDRLARGETDELIRRALADFRADPAGYKVQRAAWAPVNESGPLTSPQSVAYYLKLVATAEGLVDKMVRGKRQFNSLSELDNFLTFTLSSVPRQARTEGGRPAFAFGRRPSQPEEAVAREGTRINSE